MAPILWKKIVLCISGTVAWLEDALEPKVRSGCILLYGVEKVYNKIATARESQIDVVRSRLRSLKHLLDVKLERTPAAAAGAAAPVVDRNAALFCCPISGQEMNGHFAFVVMRNTGHVISKRALKEVSPPPSPPPPLLGRKPCCPQFIPQTLLRDHSDGGCMAVFMQATPHMPEPEAVRVEESRREPQSLKATPVALWMQPRR